MCTVKKLFLKVWKILRETSELEPLVSKVGDCRVQLY